MNTPAVPQELLVIDRITVICKGCKAERVVDFNPPMIGARTLIDYTKTKLTGCSCGHAYCDIKARMHKSPSDPSVN